VLIVLAGDRMTLVTASELLGNQHEMVDGF